MNYVPHSYQEYAANFIESHKVSALLLDMGLGKTVCTLTALNNLLFDYFDVHKVLVIAPLRIGKITWPEELKKWDHLKNLKVAVGIGTEKERIAAFRSQADIYIINRENLVWLVEKFSTHVLDFDFDTVVIDELSSFKNGKSKRFKAMCQIRPMINRIIGLTGTPAPNSLIDLWGEYRILDLGQRLGRFITHYRSLYFIPGASNGNVVFEYIPISGAEEAIFRKISDITISMNAVDHLKMPDLIKTEYKVYLSDSEYRKYRNFKRQLAIEIKGEVITAANAAVLSNKLLQVANGAIYEEESKEYVDIHDKKLDALEDIIEQANGKPILCAYWFKHDLERIKAKLSTIPNITFDEIKSDESIARWNKGKINVGLIHPMSAGHGLNLQSGGNTIVWYSLCFSLEAYQQTNARLYRQGQKASTVVVIHLVADGTIDEHALKVLQGKSDVQNAVLDAVKADLKGE